ILMVGLQGSGKTTTAAKLANLLKKKKKKIIMSSLDISRPAAIEQLKQLAKTIDVDSMDNSPDEKIDILIKNTFEEAKKNVSDVIIFDTSGRTNVDEELLGELKSIQGLTRPAETLLVTDAMIGQESINVAKAFMEYVDVTGIVLTRVDGDSKGGAALSMTKTIGKPIKYLGVGEKIHEIEAFSAKRLADRILDMGDIVGIVEKAEQEFDEKEAEAMAQKMSKGSFDLDDFSKQLQQMKKMGGKTTTLAKLANQAKGQGIKVLMVAADTFRAAATEQLQSWGERIGVRVISGNKNEDPSSIVFKAHKIAIDENYELMLIDTAGRLHNKIELMEELKKMLRIIQKNDQTGPHNKLLILDATIGQNTYSQIDSFQKHIGISGVIMTKLDGSAKGGALIGISKKYQLPIHAIGVGEKMEDLIPFVPKDFINALLGENIGDKK
ncbi:signal recognition particle-docking protein FtsY, partial [Alphaproteobacteria bacterium]|nr:signal recognition particle-docking protein FtsY [Alphaproteobacteria bacterium]